MLLSRTLCMAGEGDFRICLAPKNHCYSILSQNYDFYPKLAHLDTLDFKLSYTVMMDGLDYSNHITYVKNIHVTSSLKWLKIVENDWK